MVPINVKIVRVHKIKSIDNHNIIQYYIILYNIMKIQILSGDDCNDRREKENGI